MKIQDLKVGAKCTIPLLIMNITPRETKAKKPYLQLELFDGFDTIGGNYWDWKGDAKPPKGAVLDLDVTVVEWQSKKQLQIKAMRINNTLDNTAFMPQSKSNLTEMFKGLYSTAMDIRDDFLRDLCLLVLEEFKENWMKCPAALTVHHAYVGGLLVHTYGTVKVARAIAEATPGVCVDLCIAGALLHDIGKMQCYYFEGASIAMTDMSNIYEHTFLGVALLKDLVRVQLTKTDGVAAKFDMLCHVILSHHGVLEHGAVVTPLCLEAKIVHTADSTDTVTDILSNQKPSDPGGKWSERIWFMDNKRHLLPDFVRSVFDQ